MTKDKASRVGGGGGRWGDAGGWVGGREVGGGGCFTLGRWEGGKVGGGLWFLHKESSRYKHVGKLH